VKPHSETAFILVAIFLLSSCSTFGNHNTSKKESSKSIMSNEVIQEAIDLEMNVIVETTQYKEPIRLSGVKGDTLLAEDCEGKILELKRKYVVRTWTEFSDYKCNSKLPEITTMNSALSDSNGEAPVAKIDIFSSIIDEIVLLDGGDSFSPAGGKVSYQWRFISLPTESLSKLEQPNLRETSFIPDAHGKYIIELVVTNEYGISSTPKTVIHTPKYLYEKDRFDGKSLIGTLFWLGLGILVLGMII